MLAGKLVPDNAAAAPATGPASLKEKAAELLPKLQQCLKQEGMASAEGASVAACQPASQSIAGCTCVHDDVLTATLHMPLTSLHARWRWWC